jgi:hypothetical protein
VAVLYGEVKKELLLDQAGNFDIGHVWLGIALQYDLLM